jgi:hypothetical protein
MAKSIIQFFDGQYTRQRVVANDFIVQEVMKDLVRSGIDMRTVIATNVGAEDYDLGYLPLEYPLVGNRANGIWDFEQKESK